MNSEGSFDHLLQKEKSNVLSSMTIIIEILSEHRMKTLHANEHFTSFFFSGKNQSLEQVFGPYLGQIHEFISDSSESSHFMANLGSNVFEVKIKRLPITSDKMLLFLELQKSTPDNCEQLWKEKYESLLTYNSDALLTLNGDGEITYCNPMVKKLLDYVPKQVVGKPFNQLVSEVDQVRFNQFWSYIKYGKAFDLPHLELLHQKGHELLVSLKALPVMVKGECVETQIILKELPNYLISNSKMHYLSYHDHLTGLWNRRMLKIHFAQDSLETLNEKGKLSLIHLGIDRFKVIGESLGYMAGNQFLMMIAERLKKICTTSEKLYRNNGDEFIIVVQEYTFAQTEKLCEKVLRSFKNPFDFNGQEYYLSVSIGIATFPENGKTVDELIEKSKQALTITKERGRAHYRYFMEDMKNTFTNEALMESHLRRAIEFKELTVCFQPQVELETGRSASFEALLRWNNRKFGEVSPAKFIPLAEASGVIHIIGDWVIDQVCQRLKEWQDKRYVPVKVAINISASQLKSENFCKKLVETVSNYGLQTDCIEIEITESALMRPDETLHSLRQLKDMGFTISIDDFGTGYSSLSYLKKYPIDIIKIDRSFIQDIETDSKNKAIAKTIINLAHSLGMTVIAEGIETDSQAKIMRESKCRIAQGFLYSRAVPSEIIEQNYLKALR